MVMIHGAYKKAGLSSTFGFLVVLLLATVAATAQDDDISVDIQATHLFGYRAATWVPIDLVVKNNKRDFTGWVEIRTYQNDTLEKPIYRLPVDSRASVMIGSQ